MSISGELLMRPLRASDDAEVARIIRSVMPEFGASGPGFAILDPEVDAMHATYSEPRAAYFVIEVGGVVQGGGGVAQLAGAAPAVCELRKMYFRPSLRGRGAGRALIQQCLSAARAMDYGQCYLETLGNMVAARALYERAGFRPIPRPMGATGHFGCNAFYLLDL